MAWMAGTKKFSRQYRGGAGRGNGRTDWFIEFMFFSGIHYDFGMRCIIQLSDKSLVDKKKIIALKNEKKELGWKRSEDFVVCAQLNRLGQWAKHNNFFLYQKILSWMPNGYITAWPLAVRWLYFGNTSMGRCESSVSPQKFKFKILPTDLTWGWFHCGFT